MPPPKLSTSVLSTDFIIRRAHRHPLHDKGRLRAIISPKEPLNLRFYCDKSKVSRLAAPAAHPAGQAVPLGEREKRDYIEVADLAAACALSLTGACGRTLARPSFLWAFSQAG